MKTNLRLFALIALFLYSTADSFAQSALSAEKNGLPIKILRGSKPIETLELISVEVQSAPSSLTSPTQPSSLSEPLKIAVTAQYKAQESTLILEKKILKQNTSGSPVVPFIIEFESSLTKKDFSILSVSPFGDVEEEVLTLVLELDALAKTRVESQSAKEETGLKNLSLYKGESGGNFLEAKLASSRISSDTLSFNQISVDAGLRRRGDLKNIPYGYEVGLSATLLPLSSSESTRIVQAVALANYRKPLSSQWLFRVYGGFQLQTTLSSTADFSYSFIQFPTPTFEIEHTTQDQNVFQGYARFFPILSGISIASGSYDALFGLRGFLKDSRYGAFLQYQNVSLTKGESVQVSTFLVGGILKF